MHLYSPDGFKIHTVIINSQCAASTKLTIAKQVCKIEWQYFKQSYVGDSFLQQHAPITTTRSTACWHQCECCQLNNVYTIRKTVVAAATKNANQSEVASDFCEFHGEVIKDQRTHCYSGYRNVRSAIHVVHGLNKLVVYKLLYYSIVHHVGVGTFCKKLKTTIVMCSDFLVYRQRLKGPHECVCSKSVQKHLVQIELWYILEEKHAPINLGGACIAATCSSCWNFNTSTDNWQ